MNEASEVKVRYDLLETTAKYEYAIEPQVSCHPD